MTALHHYQSLFPITSNLKNVLKTTTGISKNPEHLLIEQDLLSNPSNQSLWLSYIEQLTHQSDIDIKEKRNSSPHNQINLSLLGNKLHSQVGRSSYQILVSVYERALIYFPTSFKIWSQYLEMRHSFILGNPKFKFNLNSIKKKKSDHHSSILEYINTSESELDDNERDLDSGWEGHLDSGLGWLEWKALASAHERSLMWLPQMPRLWLSYLTLLTHPSCPAPLSLTHTRHTFDRALRTLPHSLHERIWKPYLRWSEHIAGGQTCIRVWNRYLALDPSLTARYVQFLINEAESSTRHSSDDQSEDDDHHDISSKKPSNALVAAKLLLGLVRKSRKGTYKSPDGKSPYQLLLDFMDLCETFPNQIGLSLNQTINSTQPTSEIIDPSPPNESTSTTLDQLEIQPPPPFNGLIRMAGAPVPFNPRPLNHHQQQGQKQKTEDISEPYDPDVDPSNPLKLDMDRIIQLEGFNVYKDQLGLIYTNLATYWIKRAEFDKARETFETGMARVMTIRDFTTIFDAYAEFSEQYISTLLDSLGDGEEDDDHDGEESRKEQEAQVDEKMKEFEELMDRRPFLVNDVLLRRNPNDVQEWEKRVVLYGDQQDDLVLKTYLNAIETIHPKKSTAHFNHLFIHFAKWYEENGTSTDDQPDLVNARKVFEKAVNVNFQRVDDLAEIWIEWAEMELRNENYEEALKVIRRATIIPTTWKKKPISFHDESVPVQVRLFKSLKLWSFRVDLEESIGSIESTQKAYDSIFDLKIANAQIVVNYAHFLEENEYFEESFKVYERGISLFDYPIVFEIWNVYLIKFISRYQGNKIERCRDLFEQALENCPEKCVKSIFLLYAQFEENFGLAKRSMSILERAAEKVALDDRFEMYEYYIAKATENFGLPATRSIYEKAIKVLPAKQTALMSIRYAKLEEKLGEIDRCRIIYGYASQFCDPRLDSDLHFWQNYHDFEIAHGSEDSFREMLRIKRAVLASFNTETSYLAAKVAAATKAVSSTQHDEDEDAMKLLEQTHPVDPSFVLPKERQNPTCTDGGHANQDEIAIAIDDED